MKVVTTALGALAAGFGVGLLMTLPALGAVDNLTYLDDILPPVGLSEQLDVWVGENLAYYTGTGGLTVVDVSDPTDISATDNYNPPGAPGVKFFNAAVDEVDD